MNKMKNNKCNRFRSVDFCTYEDFFTPDNLDKSTLTNTTEGPWKYYREVPENEKLNLEGQSNFFDGSGFIYDIPLNDTVHNTRANIVSLMTEKLKNGTIGNYFSDASRSYIVNSMYYEPNRHFILERALMFEFTSSGIIEITDRKSYFKPKIPNDENDEHHFRIDLALLIMTLVGYTLNIVLNVVRTKSIREVIQLRNLLKYVIMGLVIAYFIAYYDTTEHTIEEIINSHKFMTFHTYGDKRQGALNYLTLAFFLHSLTMIRSFVFSATVNVFLNIFAQSYKDFLAFLLLFFSCFIGFSFVWWIAFGSYNENLQSLTGTAFEVFQYFATGDTLIVSTLYEVNETWAILLVISTTFIIFIQLDALMMSLIQENVRYLYLKQKHASKQKLPFRQAVDRLILKARGYQEKAQRFINGFRKSREVQKEEE